MKTTVHGQKFSLIDSYFRVVASEGKRGGGRDEIEEAGKILPKYS
jgi:hypothetical protein